MSEGRADKFVWRSGDLKLSQCVFCVHEGGASCAAFPGGIPMEILTNEFDHRQPYPGDGGIRFEPREG